MKNIFDLTKSDLKSDKMMHEDLALHVDIYEALRIGADVIFDSKTCLLIYDKNVDMYWITAKYFDEGTKVLDKYVKNNTAISVRCEAFCQHINKVLRIRLDEQCWQAYTDRTIDNLFYMDGKLEMHHHSIDDYNLFRAVYKHKTDEDLKQDFENQDFTGLYEDGKMLGFIGIHREGAIGMLNILLEYRRKGHGKALLCNIMNKQIMQERIPFSQIVFDNDASIKMHKEIGLIFSKDTQRWMWK